MMTTFLFYILLAPASSADNNPARRRNTVRGSNGHSNIFDTMDEAMPKVKICQETGNPNCPMEDVEIDANDFLYDWIHSGGTASSCAESCSECEEFDETACQCMFVSYPPTVSPTPKQTISYLDPMHP